MCCKTIGESKDTKLRYPHFCATVHHRALSFHEQSVSQEGFQAEASYLHGRIVSNVSDLSGDAKAMSIILFP